MQHRDVGDSLVIIPAHQIGFRRYAKSSAMTHVSSSPNIWKVVLLDRLKLDLE